MGHGCYRHGLYGDEPSAERSQRRSLAPAQAAPSKPGPVDLDSSSAPSGAIDADSGPAPAASRVKAPKVVDNGPAPTAGTPSDAAVQARHLYEGEKW